MKSNLYLRALLSLCAAGIVVAACFKSISPIDMATLRVFFEGGSCPGTRSERNIDTDDYILTVTGPDGGELFSGRFGDSPEAFSVPPGAYTVSAVSCKFDEPEYDVPVYGDTKVVVVASGEVASAALNCEMKNCGIKLKADASFKMAFPDAVIYIKSDEGSLQFNYGESRIGYFKPGKITVVLSNNESSETLFTRTLEERQVLSIELSSSLGETQDSAAGVSIQVDTSKEWLSDAFVYGQEGGSPHDALSISEARASGETRGIWIYGYIVGCATSTSKIEFDEPFSKNTNIVIGERSATTDRDYCMSVELKNGAMREFLNLSDNPSLKGRKIWLKGDIVSSYYGLPGIKNLSEFSF